MSVGVGAPSFTHLGTVGPVTVRVETTVLSERRAFALLAMVVYAKLLVAVVPL